MFLIRFREPYGAFSCVGQCSFSIAGSWMLCIYGIRSEVGQGRALKRSIVFPSSRDLPRGRRPTTTAQKPSTKGSHAAEPFLSHPRTMLMGECSGSSQMRSAKHFTFPSVSTFISIQLWYTGPIFFQSIQSSIETNFDRINCIQVLMVWEIGAIPRHRQSVALPK